jgi:hypothetical protein
VGLELVGCVVEEQVRLAHATVPRLVLTGSRPTTTCTPTPASGKH